MPVTQSAKKALRQSIAHRERNLGRKKDLKTAIKNYKKTPNADLLSVVFKKLDKAAKVNLIPRNTASRLKSRLSHLLAPKP